MAEMSDELANVRV